MRLEVRPLRGHDLRGDRYGRSTPDASGRSEASAEKRSLAELEGKVTECTSEREKARVRFTEAELRLQAAREREQLTARTYTALERTRHELASCPRCRKPVNGSDLLVSGRCPHCEKALTSLLTPAPRAGLDPTEYLALLGALGVLVGLALATTDAIAA